jgi:benzoyl-CoA reductase/2-hydroxyglutaryl-CoA dehydratase subunit BcrC/BadD/HgdB
MAGYYDSMLKLCGFEDEEISGDRPRIEKVFRKLEIKPEDMPVAESWLKENHDMTLLGVRKLMRIWLKELIDLVLARDEGKKLVYYGFPTISGPAAAIASSSDGTYCVCPDVVVGFTMGQIFKKIGPIIEAGEQNGLPPGHSLCSLQQTRVGGLDKGIIPVPDMVLTSSYFCDMGSKTDELLHQRYKHPAIYVDGSMDSKWGQFPNSTPERVGFLGGEIDKALDKVKEILGVTVTKTARYEGASRNRKLNESLKTLVTLMKEADPPPISVVELEMAKNLALASASRRVINEAADAINLLNSEVKERIDRGIGIIEKGAPRIAILFSQLSDPGILRMIEKNGISITMSILDLVTAKFGKSPSSVTGELVAQAAMETGIFDGNYGLISQITKALKGSDLDGFLWNYLYNCRPLAQMSHLLKQFVEKETGVAVLSLESDTVDNKICSAEAQRTSIEAFAEMLRVREVSAGK